MNAGYYRVNYDRANWQLIIEQLNGPSFKDIATINRAQLVDDALNLARAGRVDYATALDVTAYLANETDYLPWKAALTAMGFLDNMLVKLQGYDKFRVIWPIAVHARLSALASIVNSQSRVLYWTLLLPN